MRGLTGLKYKLTSTKQLGLIFDKVVFVNPRPYEYTSEIDWLIENGVVTNIQEVDADSLIVRQNEETRGACEDILLYDPKICEELSEESKQLGKGRQDDFYARSMSLILKKKYGLESCPIVDTNLHSYAQEHANRNDVISLVLHSIPVPTEATSWEQILEYRNDTDSYNRFLDLRNWMNEVARAQLSPLEVEQKIEYLISQYQRHMHLHKLKTNAGMLETVLVSSAEFFENLFSFKWGEIAKSLFTIKHRQIALMEGELTSPGGEIAYIIKAKEAFS